MDGYNPYPWNQGYYQNGVVYPPQHKDFGYDNRRNFDYHYQMPQVPSYYQDWSHTSPRNVVQPQHDFQPQQEFDPSISSSPHEERSSTDEMMALILQKMEENERVVTQQYKGLEAQFAQLSQQVTQMSQQQKTFESQISQLAIAIEKLQEEEESEEDEEQSEEDPSERKSEDDTPIIEEGQEERPLLDTSNNDHENQEASNDTLKGEMSISKPLDSSICTPFDINVSIDFILPLDNFDHKREVEENLGILMQKGGGWKDMLRIFIEEKLCIKGMGDLFTLH
ncbi:hypothetical protein ACS0TY_025099 [Phlomoides rotata]